MIKKCLLGLLSLCSAVILFAQDNGQAQMADTMRGSGKIYVVVAVVLAILLGLFLYLVRLDRKITKLERDNRIINS
ncbi:MAG TPA: CcmD family protein [Flavisolibacter sp.]